MSLDNIVSGEKQPELLRTIGHWQVTLYATGSMLGAGIYGLIGFAAGELGAAVWLGFLLSLFIALLTGLSYASLGSRYPRAGGAAYITQRAYRNGLLTYMVGATIACAGMTSMAANSGIIAENLQRFSIFSAMPVTLLTIAFVLITASIVYRGIRESMWANVACTIVEAGGLILIVIVGMRYWGTADLFETPMTEAGGGLSSVPLLLIAQGAILTFYSFLGFEDLLNISEETRNARRNIPLGLVSALAVVAGLYICVAITAVSVVPWRELADSGAPLAEVMARAAPWFPNWLFVVITIFAIANTVLINYVTASRLLYGMARDEGLPAVLGKVHAKRRTPHIAILLILAIVLALVLAGGVEELAEATVLLLLLVFAIVNFALVVLKLRPGETIGGFEIPIFIPIGGGFVCLGFLFTNLISSELPAILISMVLLALVAVYYLAARPKIPPIC
nr:MAG: amino acid permease [Hyphomicrobiales bacterium]